MEKAKLVGLLEEDYIHPDEVQMRYGNQNTVVQSGLDKLNDLSVALMRRMTLGRYIHVTEDTAPELIGIVNDVCSILDYPAVPKVYICHQAAQTIFCAGTDHMIVVISDYIVDNFDGDMLYFVIGNTISMFKSGHVGMVTAYSMMPGKLLSLPVELAIKRYLRAADMTSDRAGLLACQNIVAAMKCILWEAGMPLSEIRMLNEPETMQLCEAYIDGVENISLDSVTELATSLKEYDMDSMPHPYRIKELLAWYRTDYPEVMQKWGGIGK